VTQQDKLLIDIEFTVDAGRYGNDKEAHFAFIWPRKLWNELKSFLEEYPDEKMWFSGLAGKHSQTYVEYKEILAGITVIIDEDEIKEFRLTYGREHDFSDIDAYGMFLETVGNEYNSKKKNDENSDPWPSWWGYEPSKEELKQEKLDKWDEIKKELNGALASLLDFDIHISIEDKNEFDSFISNNELELAWDVLRGILTQHSPFSKQMTRAAELMQLSGPYFGVND